MTKKQLSEKMAKFIGLERNEYGNWIEKGTLYSETYLFDSSSPDQPEEYFFSPDGFFTVRETLVNEVAKLDLSSVELIFFWQRFNGILGQSTDKVYKMFYEQIAKIMKGDK